MIDTKKKKIGVFMGGKSSEREISLKSGEAILNSLKRTGHKAVAIDVGDDLIDNIKKEGIDIAFIALHGRWGEDGTIQGLFEMMRIPYTGTGVAGSAIAIDKILTKIFLKGLRIETPPYMVIYGNTMINFPLPFVLKPAREGSTIGVTIVKDKTETEKALQEALRFDTKVLVETYIMGREITASIINGHILPLIEIRPKAGFYDFTSKYTKGMTEYFVNTDLEKSVREKIIEYSESIVRELELKGCARIDMIVSGKRVYVIDINTSPGMTETSLVPLAWKSLGRSFDELIEEILSTASLKT